MTTAQKNEAKIRRAAALGSIYKHPSWPDFEAAIQAKIEKLEHIAYVIAMSDNGADQRKLDQIKGNIGALKWFLGVPKNAEHTLERYLREQGLEVPDD